MPDIGSATSPNTGYVQNYPAQTETGGVKQVQPQTTTGTGSVGQTGPVPDISSNSMLDAMMGSLRAFMPEISGEKLQVALLKVMTTMKDTIGETEKDKIQIDQESKRLALQEKQGKIDEAEEKAKEAQEKRESLSVWDKVKIAFQYIGAITAIIAGVLALATSWLTGPAGVVSGVLLIGAGVILLGMAADATYAAATTKDGKAGLGFVGEMHKAVLMDKGVSEEEATTQAQKADAIGRIVATAVAGAMMLGAAIAGGVSAFQLGFAVMRMVQGGVGIATNVTTAAATVASGTGDIVSATGKKEATDLEADAKDLESESKVFQALVAFLEDMIDLVMTRMKGGMESFENNLDALVQSVKDTGDTYGRVGLRT